LSEGRLFLVAAPSGAGKTSLVRALVASEPNLKFSVSYTTRTKRPSETEGVDYHFVDRRAFEAMAAAGEFLEYARVFDNYYGTGRAAVAAELTAGYDVVLEIDWQGARQVRAKHNACHSIFILPPSRAELERRLKCRATDSDAVIERRLADAVADMSHWREFDYVVVNARFDETVEALRRVVHDEGEESLTRRSEISAFVARLLA
jgi:guanylate kinase